MIFTISDEKFFDNNYIKVIDGIAGAGKSSIIDRFFKDNGKIYGRYTSTNVLKRDAQKRYPETPIETVASGLFQTDAESLSFYRTPKEVEFDNIVIDEILQTSSKVINYCYEMVGKKNIIITTDTRQMLAPECGERLLTKFLEMQNDPRVIWITLTESKRPVNDYTTDIYNDAYTSATEFSNSLFKKYSKTLNTGFYSDYTFTKDDIILTHTKDIEDFIYRDIDPRAKDLELIPKGSIGRNVPKNLDNYPVVSQKDAEERKLSRYLQAKNICTPTRYQGSEAQPGTRVFFVIENKSRVLNREFYTVLTRCKDLHDLTIVTIDLPDSFEVHTYFGKPVKAHGYLNIYKTDPEIDKQIKNGEIEQSALDNIVNAHPNDKVSYDHNMFFYKEEKVYVKDAKPKKKGGKALYTPSSVMKKDEKMHYSYTANIYRTLEKNGIDQIIYPTCLKRGGKERFDTELDLYSAYPSIMSRELIPIDGYLTYQKGCKNKLDFYVYEKEDGIIRKGALFTQELECAIPDGKYLFSLPAERGCKVGTFLYDKAHRSVESKKSLKDFHWGYYQKKYLKAMPDETNTEYYEINEYFVYEILMVAILTVLCKMVYTLSKEIESTTVVDAVHFNITNTDGKNFALPLVKTMEEKFPGYEYRILYKPMLVVSCFEGEEMIDKKLPNFPLLYEDFDYKMTEQDEEKQVLFKNYAELKTEQELRREAQRLLAKKRRAEGKVKDNRPNGKYRKKEAQV